MAKKKHKSVLPKRIAGVKVPKSVRKGALGQLLTSRTGQALLAEAIMAAGAVGVAKQASDHDDHNDKSPRLTGGVVADALRRWQGAGGGHGHGKEIDPMGATVAYALGEAARAFVRVLNEHRAQAQAQPHTQRRPQAGEIEAEWRAEADEPAGSKKKPGAWEVRP